MALGAEDPWAWVNQRPEADRPALLEDAEPFDALRTPAQRDIGTLAELFRRHPGTVVTDHPEGRFGARGGLARELTADPPWDDYLGPGSPLERLVQLGGRVLRLGADPDTVTLLHYAEYRVPLPGKRRVCRYRRVMTPDGPQTRRISCLDDENGVFAHDGEDYFATILRSYLARGRGRSGQVGAAQAELIEASDLVDYAVRWMTERFR